MRSFILRFLPRSKAFQTRSRADRVFAELSGSGNRMLQSLFRRCALSSHRCYSLAQLVGTVYIIAFPMIPGAYHVRTDLFVIVPASVVSW